MPRIRLLLCVWAFNLAFTALGDDAPAGSRYVQVVLDLADGSRVVGEPSLDRLKLTTSYAAMEIPLQQVSKVEFAAASADHEARVNLRDGDVINAKLSGGDLALKTVFGDVAIPVAQVKRITVSLGKPLPEGAVLHYTFDTSSGDQIADASEAGADGAVHGATYVNGGNIGGAMSFNGDHAAVAIKNTSSLQIQDFTIMAWIKCAGKDKATNTGTGGMGMVFGCGAAGYAFGMDKDGTLLLGRLGGDHVSSKCEIHDEAFHHVAVTKDGNRVVFYLDGAAYPAPDYASKFEFGASPQGDLEIFSSRRIMNRPTSAAVGAAPESFDNGFWGLIDELAVFKRPLSDAEIKGVYDSQK